MCSIELAIVSRRGPLTECLQERARQPAWLAGAYLLLIDHDDWQRLTSCAGEERFLGAEKVLVSQDLFPDVDVEVTTEFENKLPGNSGKQAGFKRRGEGGTILDDKQIRLGALGQLTAIIAHHGFEGATFDRLLRRQR